MVMPAPLVLAAPVVGSTTGGPSAPELLAVVAGIIGLGLGVLALWRGSRRRVEQVVAGLHGRRELDRDIATLRADGATDEAIAVLVVGVDGVAEIAATHGRAAADALVQHAGTLLSGQLRGGDRAYLVADGELVALLDGADAAAATLVAERVSHAMGIVVSPTGETATASIGVASGSAPGAAATIERGRRALTTARSSDGNRIAVG